MGEIGNQETAEVSQEAPRETPLEDIIEETRKEETEETTQKTTNKPVRETIPEEPAKLGAGFGPHGTSARTYLLMLLQAALAVLTVGVLTGGCRITVQHGAVESMHNFGGTRFSLTV